MAFLKYTEEIMAYSINCSSARGLNPCAYRLCPSPLTVAKISVALGLIIMATGFLTVLAASGVDIHALNVLGDLTEIGGVILIFAGAVPYLMGIVTWKRIRDQDNSDSSSTHSALEPPPDYFSLYPPGPRADPRGPPPSYTDIAHSN